MSWQSVVDESAEPQSCFIIGATGEVGKCLVQETLNCGAFSKVVIIARHALQYDGPNSDRLVEKIVPNFGELEAHQEAVEGCSYGFCALGTTRAKAGSPEAFRKVDHDYILAAGRLATKCRWFGVVSSAGADASSSFLYPRTKGETERDLTALGLEKLYIYRPGLLQCERSDSRPMETVAQWFAPAMNWVSRGRVAIPTIKVAKAMIMDALQSGNSSERVKIVTNQEMINNVSEL